MKKSMQSAEPIRKTRPARDPRAREGQIIAAAYDLAEERIRSKTASPSEIVHFLKMGSPKERIEQEIKEKEVELLNAKIDMIRSAQSTEETYQKALAAMQEYSGKKNSDE